jgi:hypothetical protein
LDLWDDDEEDDDGRPTHTRRRQAIESRWLEQDDVTSRSPPQHLLWHQDVSMFHPQLLRNAQEEEDDDHIPLWRLPDDIATRRLKSVVVAYDPHAVPLELLQRSLDHLCSHATSLQEVIFRIHGSEHASGALDLRPLLQLRRLRVIHFYSGLRGGWEENQLGLPDPSGESQRAYFFRHLLQAAASGSSIEQIGVDIRSEQWIMRVDSGLATELAAAFPRLHTLHLMCGVHLSFPLGGVFAQMRHLSLQIPLSGYTARLFDHDELVRSLLVDVPLLETLSLDVARWWRFCDASMHSVVTPLVPLVGAAPTLRQVTLVLSPYVAILMFLKAHTQQHTSALLGLHLLWSQIDPAHAVPTAVDAKYEKTPALGWLVALLDGLCSSASRAPTRHAHVFSAEPGTAVQRSPPATMGRLASSLRGWLTAAVVGGRTFVARMIELAASPCRQSPIHRSRRLLIERAEQLLREQVAEEVKTFGRPVVQRQFHLAVGPHRSHDY